MQVQAGDVLLTRNAGGEENNPSPGYYNHSAIISVKNWVVEAQAAPNAVIAVPIWNFFNRYPEILVLRPTNAQVAAQTAEVAPRYLGRTYSLIMSFRPLYLWKNSDSCVSLLRRIYNAVTGADYRWRIPDSFLGTEQLRQVALKKNYETYRQPVEPYRGMVTWWSNSEAESWL